MLQFRMTRYHSGGGGNRPPAAPSSLMPPPSPPPPPAPPSPPPLWGSALWTFFHAMAEHAVPERFTECREGIFRAISSLCSNLPCPICAMHAREYLDRVDWSLLRTRDDLRLFLCNYHNSVNARKQYALFDPADLAAHYAHVDVRAALHRAMFYYTGAHSPRGRALAYHSFARDRAVDMVRAWFSANAAVAFGPPPREQ